MAGKKEAAKLPAGSAHRRQFVEFRVSTYRIVLRKNPKFSVDGKEFDANDLFDATYGDAMFEAVSHLCARGSGDGGKAIFLEFLDKLYAAIEADFRDGGAAKSIDRLIDEEVFVEEDITPLVSSFSSTAELDGVGGCVINAVNPRDMFFDRPASGSNPAYRASYAANTRASQTSIPGQRKIKIGQVSSPRLPKLFDVVRVWLYAGYEHPDAKTSAIRKELIPDGLAVTAEDFTFRPVFTGVVSQIQDSNDANGSATVTIRCSSMKRMLVQSVTTFNEALASVVTSAADDIDILSDRFTSFENVFTDMPADQIVLKIFEDYFAILRASASAPTSSGSPALGIPSISKILSRMRPKKIIPPRPGMKVDDPPKANLVQMLPVVLAYHGLKQRYREPILVFDDRLSGDGHDVISGSLFERGDEPAVTGGVLIDQRLDGVLKPYLIMFRDGFANYDSSYVAPSEVIDTIKATTYMEFFEDKLGRFHFRFPRYNHARTRHDIEMHRIISVSLSRDESQVFTACTAQPQVPAMNATGIIPGRVYIDKFAILRYGFRRPDTLQNPNAISDEFVRALAKFARDYSASRRSLTASLTIVGKASIEPGQMVCFRVSRFAQPGEKLLGAKSKMPEGIRVFCGYVTSVTDDVRVSGEYTQTIRLEFVREASVSAAASVARQSGDIWDMVDAMDCDVQDPKPGKPAAGISSTPIVAEPDAGRSVDISSGLANLVMESGFLISYSIPADQDAIFSARYIPSSVDLAIAAMDPKGLSDSGKRAALASGDPSKVRSVSDIDKNADGIVQAIKKRIDRLAMYIVMSEVLDKFALVVDQQRRVLANKIRPGPPSFQHVSVPFGGLTKADLADAANALVRGLGMANIGKKREFVVRCLVNGSLVGRVSGDGRNVNLEGTVGDGRLLLPFLNMKFVLRQVDATFPRYEGGFRNSYERVFESPDYGITEVALFGQTVSRLSPHAASEALRILDTIGAWAKDLSGALKVSPTRDTEIDRYAKALRDNEVARKEAKAAAARTSGNARSATPSISGLSKAIESGASSVPDNSIPSTE